MKQPAAIVTLLSCSVLIGCTAPLAATSYPALDATTFMGTWRVEPNPGPEGEHTREDIVLHVTDHSWRVEDADGDTFTELFAPLRRDSRVRIVASIPEWHGAADPTVDGEVLVSGDRWYVSFQETPYANSSLYGVLSTPLQITLRLEREGDELFVMTHPTVLVWSPMELAVRDAAFDPDSIDGEGRWLVASFDDVIAYYDARPDSEWTASARLVRIDE